MSTPSEPNDLRSPEPVVPIDDALAVALPVHRKLLFAAVLLLMLLGGVEVACRLLGLGGRAQVARYISDWQKTPDGQTFWVLRGKGYNSDGMHDRQHEIQKPPQTHRIICLGDSVTQGHGVQRHQTYPRIFESFLQQLGVSAEVFNMAVSGWSTRQEAGAYRAIAAKYRPDHVFLGFCLNDVAEMHNNLSAPPNPVIGQLMRHSAMVRWLVDAEGRQVRRVEELFEKPDSAAVRSGWSRVFEEITNLQDMTRQDGCDFSVIVFPFRFQLETDLPPVAQQTLFRFCRKNNIPCLDLLPVLAELGSSAFIDESHLSPAGARVVAEELIRWGRTGCLMCGLDLAGASVSVCPRCAYPVGR